MSKIVTKIETTTGTYDIYESAQVGDTISNGPDTIAIKNDKDLVGLFAGELPKPKAKPRAKPKAAPKLVPGDDAA